MTSPEPVGQQLLDEESLAYEMAAEVTVTGEFAASIQVMTSQLLAFMQTLLATVDGDELPAYLAEWVRSAVRQRLALLDPRMSEELRRQAVLGYDLGVEQGNDWMRERVTVSPEYDIEVQNVIDTIDGKARERLAVADQMAQFLPMNKPGDVMTVTGQANRAATGAQADTRWVANRAVNSGTAAVAQTAEIGLLWVAERDACLHCLAYSGLTVPSGGFFPQRLTFDDKPLDLPAVQYPPRHPNCRCRVRPWSGGPNSPALSEPLALQREARRSVVRGWSAYDSQRARLAAADRLLQAGAGLPKSVEERGRRAVERGSFGKR